MSKFIALFLILSDAFLLLATANGIVHALTESPMVTAEAPINRKLGKHKGGEVKSMVMPILNPFQPPHTDQDLQPPKEVSAMDQETWFVHEQKLERKSQHHSVDKSVAGGGVVLGGFGTAFLVSVFCYIRATRRKAEEAAPENAAA